MVYSAVIFYAGISLQWAIWLEVARLAVWMFLDIEPEIAGVKGGFVRVDIKAERCRGECGQGFMN